MDVVNENISGLLGQLGLVQEESYTLVQRMIIVAVIVLLAWITNLISRKILVPAIKKVVAKTEVTWDDYLFNSKVLNNFCHIIPAIVIYVLLPFAFNDKELLLSVLLKINEVYILVVFLRFIHSFINSLYEMSSQKEGIRDRPLKGVFQMMQVIAIFIGIIFLFSIMTGKDATELFVGLGAAATILMLVFKDTIVGLVAGVQLSANDMLRPGDWITMPKYGADGMVLEVNLTTVKVRNWDNTITTVPPYTLVSDSFQNWRGMQESGGRRIKRSVNMDMNSVRFCTDKELLMYRKEGLVEADEDKVVNLTVFRRYLVQYLRNNPRVNNELTIMVRQLQPGAQGLPLELYFFSADKMWVAYETLQSDVFDFLIAVMPRFDLRVFQSPTGMNVKDMGTGSDSDTNPDTESEEIQPKNS